MCFLSLLLLSLLLLLLPPPLSSAPNTHVHTLPSPSPSPSSRPKRQAKPAADEGFWDCSVCTFRNSAEAFKCSICDVRKGTSTRYVRTFRRGFRSVLGCDDLLIFFAIAWILACPLPPDAVLLSLFKSLRILKILFQVFNWSWKTCFTDVAAT